MFGVYLLISDFLAQSQQTLAKKITQLTIQFRLKNLTHFTNLNSLNIAKSILPHHSQKPYSLYKFSSKYVSGWRQKKHLHCTISRHPRTAFSKQLKSKYLRIHVNHSQATFVPETWQAFMWWEGGGLNSFLKVACCLGFFKFFILIEIFGNSTIFQHFNTFINSLETLKFSRQFELQG